MLVHSIIPPHMLKSIAQNGTPRQKASAWASLTRSEQFRGQRIVLGSLAAVGAIPAGDKHRTVYDARHTYDLPGRLVREEGDPRSTKDPAVNEAYDGAGVTYDLFSKIYERNSIDGLGMRLDSTVHYGKDYDNAFWDGRQMVYGDGDGQIFDRFTKAIDVIGHELTHGVTQSEADLAYKDQPGALNESFSDVFGSLVKQYKLGQTAEEADWLVGAGLFLPNIAAQGIRSMKSPGTAYDDPVLGKDPQPAHMQQYVKTTEDNGGVHINSGIPNRAFYEAAIRIGGNAWEKAGLVWYKALCDKLKPTSTFRDCARATFLIAGETYRPGSREHQAVREAWAAVGISML